MKIIKIPYEIILNNVAAVDWGLTEGTEAIKIGWGCPLESPIQSIRTGIGNEVLGYINYFVPMSELAGILSLWVLAIGMYYVASIFMRWAKAVS